MLENDQTELDNENSDLLKFEMDVIKTDENGNDIIKPFKKKRVMSDAQKTSLEKARAVRKHKAETRKILNSSNMAEWADSLQQSIKNISEERLPEITGNLKNEFFEISNSLKLKFEDEIAKLKSEIHEANYKKRTLSPEPITKESGKIEKIEKIENIRSLNHNVIFSNKPVVENSVTHVRF